MAKKARLNERVPTEKIIKDGDPGITVKRFVRMGGGRGPNGRIQPSKTYMLKPYYEDLDDEYSYYPYPTAGWSELATQALMHAGGLGHMSQVVHAHLPSSGSPILAVEIAQGMQRVGNIDWDISQDDSNGPSPVTDASREDAAKLAAMDFLTDNADRHGNNILARMSTDSDAHKSIDSLLAIDHGRSFHYRTALAGGSQDNLMDHLDSDGYSIFGLKNPKNTHAVMHAIAGWWEKHGSAIRLEMKKQLKGIKVPGMFDNINDHFGYRADALDKMVKTLKRVGAKAYHPDKPHKKAFAELSVPVGTHTPRGKIWDPDGKHEPRKIVTLKPDGDWTAKRDTAGNTMYEEQGY
jgi:hypothetical protein